MAKAVYGDKIVTPIGRVQYGHLAEPNNHPDFGSGKYEAVLLIEKTTDVSAFRTALEDLAKKAFPDKDLSEVKLPMDDGDTKPEKWEGFAGHIFIKPKSKDPVKLVGPQKNPIVASDLYNGAFARMRVTPATYVLAGNAGITLYLDSVQKVEDGDKFKDGEGEDFDTIDNTISAQDSGVVDDIQF